MKTRLVGLTLLLSLAAVSSVSAYLTGSFSYVRTQVEFNTVATFAPDNPTEIEIGNVSAATLSSRVSAAHAGGYGGVLNFENSSFLNTGADTALTNNGTSLRAQNLVANLGVGGPALTIRRGPLWIVEASGSGNLGTAAGPGLASTGDAMIDGQWFFTFTRNPSENRRPASGTDVLGGPTSWDFAFDASAQVQAMGLSYLARNNFQWYDGGTGTPTLFAKVTYSDNSTAQFQTGLKQVTDSSWDVFVGFEAPAGLSITGFHVWHRGVNNRAFGSIDDLLLITVPEPATAPLLATLGLLAGLAWRRTRRRS